MTPKSAWESVAHLIPRDKVIYEAFYGDGTSGRHLRELGFNVILEPIDFFKNTHLGDLIVSNRRPFPTSGVVCSLRPSGDPSLFSSGGTPRRDFRAFLLRGSSSLWYGACVVATFPGVCCRGESLSQQATAPTYYAATLSHNV
jgi:hypothetical protein